MRTAFRKVLSAYSDRGLRVDARPIDFNVRKRYRLSLSRLVLLSFCGESFMQRHFFRLSSLANLSARNGTGKQLRRLSCHALLSVIGVCGMLGCSSEPEQSATAQATGGQPAAQNAAPGGMPGMQPGAMPGMQPGAIPGVAPMPNGGAAMNPQQMAQMQSSNAGGLPMPQNSGGGSGPTPEQLAKMQSANPGSVPMPQNSGSNAAMTPEQMAQMQRAGAGAVPMPQNSGSGAALTPEQLAQMQRAGAAANPMPVAGGAAALAAGNPMPGGAGFPNGAAGVGFAGVPGSGGPGSGVPGGGAPQSPNAQVGTAEYSAQKVVLQLLSGDVSGLEEFISPKCKGLLGDVRDGKVTDQQKEELKKLFVGLQVVGKPRVDSGAKVLTVRNADGATITFKVKKEGESQKVTEMTVKQGAAKKR